mmetsp:Transcript_84867/g.226884  ORF Transcript_84867/g.226884 Transcript_84867/m.226884 type:complete len:263 (+) Transcript_84867:960-1748(+)
MRRPARSPSTEPQSPRPTLRNDSATLTTRRPARRPPTGPRNPRPTLRNARATPTMHRPARSLPTGPRCPRQILRAAGPSRKRPTHRPKSNQTRQPPQGRRGQPRTSAREHEPTALPPVSSNPLQPARQRAREGTIPDLPQTSTEGQRPGTHDPIRGPRTPTLDLTTNRRRRYHHQCHHGAPPTRRSTHDVRRRRRPAAASSRDPMIPRAHSRPDQPQPRPPAPGAETPAARSETPTPRNQPPSVQRGADATTAHEFAGGRPS